MNVCSGKKVVELGIMEEEEGESEGGMAVVVVVVVLEEGLDDEEVLLEKWLTNCRWKLKSMILSPNSTKVVAMNLSS